MNRFLPILINLAFFPFIFPALCFSMHYSMGTSHFARDIEFYYQKPRPEIIKPAIAAMSREGLLDKSEIRLFLAAFLAELVREKKMDLAETVNYCKQFNLSGRSLAAWLIHLAGLPNANLQLENLLEKDKTLLAQLKRTPAPLSSLKPDSDKTVLQMYWGAFMASGQIKWLDAIIDTATAWHEDRQQGRKGSVAGAQAAASLYEYASAHEIVRKRLEERLAKNNGNENEILQIILRKQ